MTFADVVARHYPGAVEAVELARWSRQALTPHDFTADNAFPLVGLCRDELLFPVEQAIHDEWGPVVPAVEPGGPAVPRALGDGRRRQPRSWLRRPAPLRRFRHVPHRDHGATARSGSSTGPARTSRRPRRGAGGVPRRGAVGWRSRRCARPGRPRDGPPAPDAAGACGWPGRRPRRPDGPGPGRRPPTSWSGCRTTSCGRPTRTWPCCRPWWSTARAATSWRSVTPGSASAPTRRPTSAARGADPAVLLGQRLRARGGAARRGGRRGGRRRGRRAGVRQHRETFRLPVVLDLDRPTRGIVKVPATPLTNTRAALQAGPATGGPIRT